MSKNKPSGQFWSKRYYRETFWASQGILGMTKTFWAKDGSFWSTRSYDKVSRIAYSSNKSSRKPPRPYGENTCQISFPDDFRIHVQVRIFWRCVGKYEPFRNMFLLKISLFRKRIPSGNIINLETCSFWQ